MKELNLIEKFKESVENWEVKLQNDEWYFVKLRKEITSTLKPNEAFDLVSDAVELVLKQNDEFLCLEAFVLLLSLSRASDTTEMPSNLEAKYVILCNHVSQFGDYHIYQVNELKRWYRKSFEKHN